MKKALFVFLSTVLTLAAFEGSCRVVELLSSPVLSLHAALPSQLVHLSQTKTESELRVFIYGGSVAFGGPVQEVGLSEQLKFILEDHYKDKTINLINLAKPGEDSELTLQKIHESIDWSPDIIIVLPIHNEFLARNRFRLLKPIADQLAMHLATFRLLDRMAYLPDRVSKNSAMGNNLKLFAQGSTEFERRIVRYKNNIKSMINLAKSRNISIILCTGSSNIRDWPPVEEAVWPPFTGRNVNKEFMTMIDSIVQNYTEMNLEYTEDLIDQGLMQYPDNALLRFWRGRTEAAMGNFRQAYLDFTFAKDADPMPWRQLSKLNAILKSEASEAGVYVADLAEALESSANHRLVGFDLMVDNCHPTPWGYYLMAIEILNQMSHARVIDGSFVADIASFKTFIDMSGFYDPKSDLELEYFMRNGLYVLKVPFFNFSLSRRYFDRAKELDPDNAQIWANLATLSFLKHDNDRGRIELEKATSLSKKPIDPADREFAPYLKEALEKAGGRAHPIGGSLQ